MTGELEGAVYCHHIVTGWSGIFHQVAGCTWGIFHPNDSHHPMFTCSRGDVNADPPHDKGMVALSL